jgi:hypothetical protein
MNPKQWTLMFYFASDNPLAPGIVSQLKAIKDAGFHKEVNVIARFDPHTTKTPTHILDVNIGKKLESNKEHEIGFVANDPYVRSLIGDKLWSTEMDRHKKLIRDRIIEKFAKKGIKYDPPQPPAGQVEINLKEGDQKESINRPTYEPDPSTSLKTFLHFCAKEYPARHYMLFILGHGIVVGNDLFLYDEHADKELALKLKDLGESIRTFVNEDLDVGTLELVSFHSCSMSGFEVAYELKDTAKYMLASQGPAFVGSWPYRQILIRVFNDVKEELEDGNKINVDEMVKKIFYYCFYNSYDFQLAGYSFDVTLTDLRRISNQTKHGIKAALVQLSRALISVLPDVQDGEPERAAEAVRNAALQASLARDLIIFSHWEAQSYYEEYFTDLFDFCFCLHRRCVAAEQAYTDKVPGSIGIMKEACEKVLKALGCERIDYADRTDSIDSTERTHDSSNDSSPIVRAGFAGPAYQYSHGLSIYFPWSRPEESDMWTNQYWQYQLSLDTDNCWGQFLEKYFKATMRLTQAEEKTAAGLKVPPLDYDAELLEDIGGLVFNEYGQLKDGRLDSTNPKDTKVDPTGGGCGCTSMKNYPPITRKVTTKVPASPDLLEKLSIF